jgi:hypothetical protein
VSAAAAGGRGPSGRRAGGDPRRRALARRTAVVRASGAAKGADAAQARGCAGAHTSRRRGASTRGAGVGAKAVVRVPGELVAACAGVAQCGCA